ncbi:MAG: hypothetical protein VYE15_01080 [Myxococcota bacterium]|nr:hypothetical protein [Myxococcota bacterium]
MHFSSVPGTLTALLLGISLILGTTTAEATWDERADLIYGSANTLDNGEIEVGLFSPLQYGITDQVQIAMHPVLLLMLTPHGALRWRLLPDGEFTASIDVEGTWSFLDKVDNLERRVLTDGPCGTTCGYPGSVQITGTGSWEISPRVLLSASGGFVTDFLDLNAMDKRLTSRASLAWLLNPNNLLLLHGFMDLSPWEDEPVGPWGAQISYAHAWGVLHLAVGLAVGEFQLVIERETVRNLGGDSGALLVESGNVKTFPVFPMIDLWFRL